MEISNPRRILAVAAENESEHLSKLISDLTKSTPQPHPETGLAGITHQLELKTRYYTASVPIWLDLVPSLGNSGVDDAENPAAGWADAFLAPEAEEVRLALGGVMIVLGLEANAASPASASAPASSPKQPSTATDSPADSKVPATTTPDFDAQPRALLAHAGRLVDEGLGGHAWDGVALAIGVSTGPLAPASRMEDWEDACRAVGLEFVLCAPGVEGRNEYGEKVGMERVKEALEASEWDGGGGEGFDGLGDDEEDEEFGGFVGDREGKAKDDKDGGDLLDPETMGFGFDKEDFVGLRQAIASAGRPMGEGGRGDEEDIDDDDVLKMERMMHKLMAVREKGAGMPEEQRRRMAEKAVIEVMKEL